MIHRLLIKFILLNLKPVHVLPTRLSTQREIHLLPFLKENTASTTYRDVARTRMLALVLGLDIGTMVVGIPRTGQEITDQMGLLMRIGGMPTR